MSYDQMTGDTVKQNVLILKRIPYLSTSLGSLFSKKDHLVLLIGPA